MNCFKNFFEDSQKSLNNRFNYLDGYRGMCAIIVIVHHIIDYYGDGGDFYIFFMSGYFIGVFGFFVLSSFLLTYRMTKEFSKCENFSDLMKIIKKYFIRRFFRIYIPYMIFVSLVKLGPKFIGGYYNYLKGNPKYGYSSWLNLSILKPTGHNHIWTIPIEIKFYFLIPILCLAFHITKTYWHIFTIVSSFLVFVLYNTIIKYNPDDIDLATSNKLYPRFPIFFSGSIIAFVYFKYENCCQERFKNVLNLSLVKFIFSLLNIFLWVLIIKKYTLVFNPSLNFYQDSISPGIYSSLLIFIMLISSPNLFTKLFSDNYFLTEYGKYSFGAYLLHPMCILAKSYFNLNNRIQFIPFIVLLSLLFGYLFYFLIENPSMKLGNYFIKRIEEKKQFILSNI